MSKEITIPVPDGKRAEWINGVLTLVDEQKVENRPVTERIKTFEDACNELGEDNPLVEQYRKTSSLFKGKWASTFTDILDYLKLRIITAALNEGWEPQFTEDEYRYFPLFEFFTQSELNEMSDDEKGRVAGRAVIYSYAYGGIAYAHVYYAASNSFGFNGSRLAFRTRELAEYAGRQFVELYADFVFPGSRYFQNEINRK